MCSNKPSILVVSTTETKPKLLIELITQTSDIKEESQHRLSQSWTIDTKYYTANVDVHIITQHYQRDDDFNESVKALIIHMDCNISDVSDLSKWEAVQIECDPEVKLLVSDYSDETNITSDRVAEWCQNHGFEFIVLYPKQEIIEDELIKEKFGVDRIVEALQTYIWPNLQMKQTAKTHSIRQNHQTSNSHEQFDNHSMFSEILEDDGLDDFTELFGQLHMMKQSIQSLPSEERKQCAEQMVTAFWKAIGGEDEELEDI